MRDLALIAGMLAFFPISLRFPAAGLMCWEWFSMMSPHRQVYGFADGAPLNSVIAAATLIGWLVSRERKRWTRDAMPWVMLLLLAWMALNTPLAPYPSYSAEFLDRTFRIMIPIFLTFVLINNKSRIHGMVWTIVISLGFYGLKGGVFTIMHGGSDHVYGPPETVYGDNNQLALAVVTQIPLLFYLWKHTQLRLIRLVMAISMGLQVIMVFGSYSRGGVIAMGAMLAMLWWRSDRKILYGLVAAVVIGGGLSLMPPAFFDRLHTVNSLDSDDSFQGRVDAWKVAYMYANDHFPFGAGFYAPQLASIFNTYMPGHITHAAHSIYFQVLGEHGYGGFAIFLVMLVLGVRNAGKVCRQTRNQPGLRWAYDLADMSRVSLISFYIGGAALSMAYADEYLLVIAMMSTLGELTAPPRAAPKPGMDEHARREAAGQALAVG